MPSTLICISNIHVDVAPPTCDTGWISTDTGLGWDVSQLDPQILAEAFIAGSVLCFGLYGLAWSAGFVISLLR